MSANGVVVTKIRLGRNPKEYLSKIYKIEHVIVRNLNNGAKLGDGLTFPILNES